MADRIESCQPEELFRFQERNPPWPGFDQVGLKPAAPDQRGDEQGVKPYNETCVQPQQGANLVAAPPEEPSNNGGANCSTAANETRPMVTSVYDSPACRSNQ